ncbi:OsmC family protein [Maribellus maritimus]|uniref:OsmC family protein n=1 Tax=Maribellus maritimus TaxID=2870838 RepID=UPI001EEACF49|nr:OsmC family protein [Maribellus maritimus]
MYGKRTSAKWNYSHYRRSKRQPRKREYFPPTDLPAVALGNCIMTIMGIKARDNNIDLKGTTVDVTKIMASEPHRVAEIIVDFYFPKKNYSAEEKRIVESVAGTSPVPLSLHPDLKQTIKFNW